MKKLNIARALRDAEYRNSLSAEEQALLPAHPAGVSTLEDEVLKSIAGGCNSKCGPTTYLYSCVEPGQACP